MSNPLNRLIECVKRDEFYCPRPYTTVGGMWTVDTWCRGDVTVQLMDEGYTILVFAPGLKVVSGYSGKDYTFYSQGNESLVKELLGKFK